MVLGPVQNAYRGVTQRLPNVHIADVEVIASRLNKYALPALALTTLACLPKGEGFLLGGIGVVGGIVGNIVGGTMLSGAIARGVIASGFWSGVFKVGCHTACHAISGIGGLGLSTQACIAICGGASIF